jgi:aspartate/methionine/tyrosine aminotransferase
MTALLDLSGGAIAVAPACPPLEALGGALCAVGCDYAPPEGRRRLRDLLRQRLETPDDRDVIVTSGASLGIASALRTLTQPGDAVLIPDCAYPGFAAIARVLHLRIVRYPLGGTPPREARASCFVVNSPHNPTGLEISGDALEAIVAHCADTSCTLLADHVYSAPGPEQARLAAAARRAGVRCVEVGSLSKTFAMAGWRVGYVVAEAALATAIATTHHALAMSAPATSQRAAEELLAWQGLPIWQIALAERLEERRMAARGRLEGAGFLVCGGQTPFLWVTPGNPRLPFGSMPSLALRAGVTVADGQQFEGRPSNSFRINVAALDQPEFDLAIDRLCRLHAAAARVAAR